MKVIVKSYDNAPGIEVDVLSIDVPFDVLALEAKKLANISPQVPIMLFGLIPIGFEQPLPQPILPMPSTMLRLNIRVMNDENNKTISAEVPRFINIRHLKYILCQDEKDTVGDVPGCQRYFFAGEQLEFPNTIDHYNIYNSGTTLDLAVIHFYQDKKLIVTIKTVSGKTFPLNIYKCHRARNIKDLIQQQQGIPIDQEHHKLCFQGEVLDEKRVISYYYIVNGSTLLLVDDKETIIPRTLHINVEIVATGKIIRLQVKNSDTINNVKAKIQDLEDIPIAKQMLYLPQKRLMNDLTLDDYYIWDDSTLHLAQTQTPPPDYQKSKEDAEQGRITEGPHQFTLSTQTPPRKEDALKHMIAFSFT